MEISKRSIKITRTNYYKLFGFGIEYRLRPTLHTNCMLIIRLIIIHSSSTSLARSASGVLKTLEGGVAWVYACGRYTVVPYTYHARIIKRGGEGVQVNTGCIILTALQYPTVGWLCVSD